MLRGPILKANYFLKKKKNTLHKMVLHLALNVPLKGIFSLSSQLPEEGAGRAGLSVELLLTTWLRRYPEKCMFATLNFISSEIVKSKKNSKNRLIYHKNATKYAERHFL